MQLRLFNKLPIVFFSSFLCAPFASIFANNQTNFECTKNRLEKKECVCEGEN